MITILGYEGYEVLENHGAILIKHNGKLMHIVEDEVITPTISYLIGRAREMLQATEQDISVLNVSIDDIGFIRIVYVTPATTMREIVTCKEFINNFFELLPMLGIDKQASR